MWMSALIPLLNASIVTMLKLNLLGLSSFTFPIEILTVLWSKLRMIKRLIA